jgi:hypothetical protein
MIRMYSVLGRAGCAAAAVSGALFLQRAVPLSAAEAATIAGATANKKCQDVTLCPGSCPANWRYGSCPAGGELDSCHTTTTNPCGTGTECEGFLTSSGSLCAGEPK